MPDIDPLDHAIRSANFVDQDTPARPVADLLARLEDPRPLRTRVHRRAPLLAIGIALAVSGTAAATVAVLDRTGPSTGLEATATPDSPASKRLTGLFEPTDSSRLPDGRKAFPELGDAGPVSGVTIRHGAFDVDVAQDGAKVCFSAHLPGQPATSGGCTGLPIPFDALPLDSGGTLDPKRRIYFSVAPDGVRDLTVITKDGRRKTEPFVDNVAAVTFDGDSDMADYTWTLPDGSVKSYRP